VEPGERYGLKPGMFRPGLRRREIGGKVDLFPFVFFHVLITFTGLPSKS
jgi:hypothetical protein